MADRTTALYEQQLGRVYAKRDRVFVKLFFAQWAAAIAIAVVWSPYGWAGKVYWTNLHVYYAAIGGGLIVLPTALLVHARPGATLNRYVIASLQMIWSALFIHLTGGRIETHFHIFGSLAFLAFYRDWKVLVPATLTVACDHLFRGMFWSESVYGVVNPEWWRFLEHAFWVVFEDVVLVLGIVEARREMRATAAQQAALEELNHSIEKKVADAIDQRDRVEVKLRLAQKLEAVGRLAAGVAHEINTPIQFVGDNLQFLAEATEDIHSLTALLRKSARVDAKATIEALEERIELPHLEENMPKAFERMRDGLSRVATIVRSMQEFAHPDVHEMKPVDLNHAITTTVNLARNEYKYVADVTLDLGVIDPIVAHPGEINQAILNLLVNAAHAIQDASKVGARGTITISTRQEGARVILTVADTGGGIPESIRDRIFDPFFTTKPVGKGTGQGLAVVRSVVQQHGGSIDVESAVGEGTRFAITLPAAA